MSELSPALKEAVSNLAAPMIKIQTRVANLERRVAMLEKNIPNEPTTPIPAPDNSKPRTSKTKYQ